jgi:hypothetical protein
MKEYGFSDKVKLMALNNSLNEKKKLDEAMEKEIEEI